jgi:hypothetical protein
MPSERSAHHRFEGPPTLRRSGASSRTDDGTRPDPRPCLLLLLMLVRTGTHPERGFVSTWSFWPRSAAPTASTRRSSGDSWWRWWSTGSVELHARALSLEGQIRAKLGDTERGVCSRGSSCTRARGESHRGPSCTSGCAVRVPRSRLHGRRRSGRLAPHDRPAVGTYMIRLMGAVDHSSRRPLALGSGPRVAEGARCVAGAPRR